MRPSLGVPLPHAWITADGEAYDLTWVDLNGGNGADCLYFGVEFSTKAVGRILTKRGYYGLLDPVDDFVQSQLEQRRER